MPNFFRKPFGPGWALVGDAGYNKDFITAQGINDAFRDAELCADGARRGVLRRPLASTTRWPATSPRATSRSCRCTSSPPSSRPEPPPPDWQQLLAAVHGNREAMDAFARVNAGVTSPAEFFSDDNVARIFAMAESRQASYQCNPGRL